MIFFKPLSILTSVTVTITFIMLYSCTGEPADNKSPQSDTVTVVAPADQPPRENSAASQFPQIQSSNIELKTFEVKDSSGKSKGWGYDIYVDNKKMIHQPIIPAIPGNNAFRTETDAQKTGGLAVEKMKKNGSLPTLSVKELDSLGVTKK